MELEEIVASIELCEELANKFPELFQDSAMVWEYSMSVIYNGDTPIEQKQHINLVQRKYFRGDEYTTCIPAPHYLEIANILITISGVGFVSMDHSKNDYIDVSLADSNADTKAVISMVNPADAALNMLFIYYKTKLLGLI